MNRSFKRHLSTSAAALAIACAAASVTLRAAPPPPQTRPASLPATNPVKALLADELNQLDREIASRMIRRNDYPPARRGRIELEIDLRILERAVIATAADARFESNEQAAAWLRARQFRDAVRSVEEARSQDSTAAGTPSQQEAIAQLHKLSYAPAAASDDFCKNAALALANAANPSPVGSNALPAMRPRPVSNVENAKDHAPTVGELTDDVHRLAAISGTLRQQLLGLAALAGAEKDDKTLTTLLAQSVALTKGLQSNTAVGPEARIGIETQLAEGIVLFTDPRTRDAGKSRVESLSQYRQTLGRIGKLGLSREQTDQLAPAFAWAQANPDAGGTRLLTTIEQYFDACAQWDALPANVVALPAPVRRAVDDLRSQFARVRGAFLQEASRIGSPGGNPASLDAQVEDAKRLAAVADDLLSTPASLDTLNALKPRPAGALEKRLATAAASAAAPTFAATRTDGQKFLDAVHNLATLTRDLGAKPLSEIPAPVVQAWAGGRLDSFDHRWHTLAADLANSLAAGATDLDAPKFARLQTGQKLIESLRTAAQLEAALTKIPSLARWADWSIDPAALHAVLAPYKEATGSAVFGFASDTPDAMEKWQHLAPRYQPLIALILRDAAYADQCQALPIGVVADTARLATPFDNAPFATERYASYAVTVWAQFEKSDNDDASDRLSLTLARRLARDLKLDLKIDDTPPRKKR